MHKDEPTSAPVVDSEVMTLLWLAVAIVDNADVEEVRGLAAALLAKLDRKGEGA